jgi:hypothetical protein
MTVPPHLVDAGEEPKLDVAVGRGGRQQFALSDRAEAMLVDDLGYGNRDVVPWVTTKTLALAGGAYLRGEKTTDQEFGWTITGADGGRDATGEELERLADYLRCIEIDTRAVETIREHVRATRLSEFLSPDEVDSKRERVTGLRSIARDL